MGAHVRALLRGPVRHGHRVRGHRQPGFLAGYLASRAGARYATLIRQALEAHIRPTSLILHTQPTDPWDELDFLVVEAWALYKDELCSNCGLPRYLCHNDDPDLHWDVMEDSCAAKAAVEQREEDERRNGGENYKPEKGTRLYPKPVLLSGGDPVSLRESYYRREAEKYAELERLETLDAA